MQIVSYSLVLEFHPIGLCLVVLLLIISVLLIGLSFAGVMYNFRRTAHMCPSLAYKGS